MTTEAAPARLTVEHFGAVAWLTLNRPEALNALDDPLAHQLVDTLTEIAERRETRCVVLTGAGRAFCAGGDMRALAERRDALRSPDVAIGSWLSGALAGSQERMSASAIMHQMPKPVVTMINGVAVGGGMALALAGDLRVASADARLLLRFPELGLCGDYGISYFLHHLLGPARATEAMFLGGDYDAAQALALGLVNRVHPPGTLREETMALAQALAARPTLALAKAKEQLLAARTRPIGQVIALEALNTRITSLSADAAEGARALGERRAPRFVGR